MKRGKEKWEFNCSDDLWIMEKMGGLLSIKELINYSFSLHYFFRIKLIM